MCIVEGPYIKRREKKRGRVKMEMGEWNLN